MGRRSGQGVKREPSPGTEASASTGVPSSKRGRKPSIGGSGGGESCGKEGLSQEVSKVDKILLLNPWLKQVIDRFDKEWALHGDVTQILYHHMPDAAVQLEWSTFLAETFPADPGTVYMESHASPYGRCFVRPYMWCWDRQRGNKGFIDKLHFKNLLTLVLTRGFNTDPSVPGTELPLICGPQEVLQLEGDLATDEVEKELCLRFVVLGELEPCFCWRGTGCHF